MLTTRAVLPPQKAELFSGKADLLLQKADALFSRTDPFSRKAMLLLEETTRFFAVFRIVDIVQPLK
jgi:hypothetical protein